MNEYERTLTELSNNVMTIIDRANLYDQHSIAEIKKMYSETVSYNLSCSQYVRSEIAQRVSFNLHISNLAIRFASQLSFFLEASKNRVRYSQETINGIWQNFHQDAIDFNIQGNFPTLYRSFETAYATSQQEIASYERVPQTEPPRIDEGRYMNDVRRKDKQLNRIHTKLEGGIDRDFDRTREQIDDMFQDGSSSGLNRIGGRKRFL